jgi:hypothetical protein
MSRLWFFAVVMLALVNPPALGGTFNFQNEGFSLTFPPGWIVIPKEVLDQAQAEMAASMPNAPRPNYDYAIQFGNRDQWFSYPYVLIKVIKTGRPSESQLRKVDKFDAQDYSKDIAGSLRPALTQIEVGKMRYDSMNRVVWMNTGSSVSEVGMVSGISAMLPTEYGVVHLIGYAKEQDFLGFLSVFEEVVRSASFSDSVKYQTRISDHLPGWLSAISIEKLIISAIIGAALGIIALRKKN